MNSPEWKIPLSKELLQRLSVKVTDQGSFPDLVREVQGRIEEGLLIIDARFVERVGHDAYVYGRGPWQLLLREVLAEIDASSTHDRHGGRDRGVRERNPDAARSRLGNRVASSSATRVEEWTVRLSDGLLARLGEDVTESGSFPDLVRELQGRIRGNVLAVDELFVRRVGHDAYMYGKGPWQLLLREVLDEIESTGAPQS